MPYSIYDKIMSRSKNNSSSSNHEYIRFNGNYRKINLFLILLMIITSLYILISINYKVIMDMYTGFFPRPVEKSSNSSPFADHAHKAGIKKCESVFSTLGKTLTSGSQYNLRSSWNEGEPDKHAIHSLVGMKINSRDYSGPAAGVVFASPNGLGCQGTVIRVVPYPKACDAVVKILPSKSRKVSELGPVTAWDLADNGGEVLLLPSGQSCVVVSTINAFGT